MQQPPALGADPFLDRLVRHLDPHAAAPPRAEPIICGRWLLLRRIAAGLMPEALAARAGLAPEAVPFLCWENRLPEVSRADRCAGIRSR